MSIYRLGMYSLFSAALLVCSSAFAHGPTRQKVTEKIVINAPASDVWAVISEFSAADTWMPRVKNSSSEDGNVAGAIRILELENGKTLRESLKKYNADKMMYSTRMPAATHDVSVLPVTNYSSSILVKADGDTSVVTLKGAFYRGYPNNDPPEELSDEAAVKAVKQWYVENLESIKQIAESK